MSVDFDTSKQRWRVRWREDGRQRSKRFASAEEAVAFDESLRVTDGPSSAPAVVESTATGDAIYPYETKAGRRYRFVFRQSDGTLSSRRGFVSRRAAATARRQLIASIERHEVVVSRDTFAGFWERFLEERRAYLTAGSLVDLTTHGHKRLLPFFSGDRLSDTTRTAYASGAPPCSRSSTRARSRPRPSTTRAHACPSRSTKPPAEG